ncbi:hypothetical protein [Terrabacter sp. Ter38]|uniref:hypothetical protein n=1 Tax=Terrabacter sp. Ter38 TaxID=2926030 RepID=UPI0035B1004E
MSVSHTWFRSVRGEVALDEVIVPGRPGPAGRAAFAGPPVPVINGPGHGPAGSSFWGLAQFQVRLGQVRGGAAQNLVLLLEQPASLLQLAKLLGLLACRAGPDPVLDVVAELMGWAAGMVNSLPSATSVVTGRV